MGSGATEGLVGPTPPGGGQLDPEVQAANQLSHIVPLGFSFMEVNELSDDTGQCC